MKKLFALVCLMLILISASSTPTTNLDTLHTIEGTWELQSFYNFDGQEIVDTIPTDPGYRQVKMYYNGKIMWSRTTAEDTKDADGNDVVGKFGYGTYRITADELIEVIEYGDEGMLPNSDSYRTFVFELWLGDNKYSQIRKDEEGNRIFSENYIRID